MAKGKEPSRVNTGPERNALTNNPFAALAGGAPTPPAPADSPPSPAPVRVPYAVGRTKKGGLPIRVERRPGGKVVTVLSNVTGDADALLRALKSRCGAGGACEGGSIELQGDHTARLPEVLRQLLG